MSELTVQYQDTETESPPKLAACYTQFNRPAIRTPALEALLQASLQNTLYEIRVLKYRLHFIDVEMAVAKALVYVDESERQTRIFYYTHYQEALNRQLTLKTEYTDLLTELLEKKPRTELQHASLLSKKVRMELQIFEQTHHVKHTRNKAISADGIDMVLPGFVIQLKNRKLVTACATEKARERKRVRQGA